MRSSRSTFAGRGTSSVDAAAPSSRPRRIEQVKRKRQKEKEKEKEGKKETRLVLKVGCTPPPATATARPRRATPR
jgi:hypothetical protein